MKSGWCEVEGEFIWHQHDDTDELFLVLDGTLDIEMRDRTVTLRAGELFVVPRGTEHRPAARNGEAKLLLIDPKDMPNTGDRSDCDQGRRNLREEKPCSAT